MTRIGNGGEQDLVRDIQRGDRVAMKLLYCRYAGCLTAVCSRYVACMDDVRDVLQDCFVKIFTSIHGSSGGVKALSGDGWYVLW